MIGQNNSSGSVTQTYATGSVTGGAGSSYIGGLVGDNLGRIAESYASGLVSAPNATNVGGFVGDNQNLIATSYWDTYSTGQTSGVGADSGDTQLNAVTSDPAQSSSDELRFQLGQLRQFRRQLGL